MISRKAYHRLLRWIAVLSVLLLSCGGGTDTTVAVEPASATAEPADPTQQEPSPSPVAIATTAPAATRAPPPPTAPPPSPTVVPEAADRVLGFPTTRIAADDAEVWALAPRLNSLHVISPVTRERVADVRHVCPSNGIDQPSPMSLSLGPQSVRVSCYLVEDRVIDRVSLEVTEAPATEDATSGSEILESLLEEDLAPGTCVRPRSVAEAGGFVWYASIVSPNCFRYESSRIDVVDASDGSLVWSSRTISGVSVRLSAMDGEVWVSGMVEGKLRVYDAATHEMIAEVGNDLGRSNANEKAQIIATDEFVWVLNHAWAGAPTEVVVVDRLNRRVLSRTPVEAPHDMAISNGAAWIASDRGVFLVTPEGA